MARYSGNAGVIGAAASGSPAEIGEVKSFNLNISADRVEASSIGDTWKGSIAGLESWECSLTCNYDPSDTAQGYLTEGQRVQVSLYPAGVPAGQSFAGYAYVTSVSVNTSENEVVSYDVTLSGDGSITRDGP